MTIALVVGPQLAATPSVCMVQRSTRSTNVTTTNNPTATNVNFELTNRPDFSRGMDLAIIQPVTSLRTVTNDDIARIIPNDLNPTNDGGNVATQILDHSLSNFFNSDAVKRSDFGRTAHQVEKSMESEAGFGGNETGSIRHTFKFAMKAAQAKAQVEYSGLTNAQLSYQAAQGTTNLEIHEDLGAATKVVFNHINAPDDRRDTVSLRWNW